MGSCSLRLHAPQQVSSSVHLSGLVLDAHRYIGKEKITSENKAKITATEQLLALMSCCRNRKCGGFPHYFWDVYFNSVKKYGT